jgi:GNAT superfamily N-acetyltransferase
MQVVPATGPLLQGILDSSYSLWGEGLSRKAYAQYNLTQMATPWGRAHLDRVALVEKGRVLSSAKRYEVDLSIDGRPARALGIGAVFTPAELRGRGFARVLLDRLVDQAARDGYHLALLFSEIGAAYYERAGFSVVPLDTLRLVVDRKEGAPGVVVRSGEPRDLPLIAAMDAELAARYRLHVRRSPEWIEYGLAKKRLLAGLGSAGSRDVLFLIVEEGGRAVAYVVVATSPRGWTLEECGDRDPSGARAGALLQVLLAREPASAPPVMLGWMPEGWLPPQLSIASRAAAEQVMMVRPVSATGRFDPPLAPADVHCWHGDAF